MIFLQAFVLIRKELGLKIHSNLLFLSVKLENGLWLHSIKN